jgi:hypothetical protein
MSGAVFGAGVIAGRLYAEQDGDNTSDVAGDSVQEACAFEQLAGEDICIRASQENKGPIGHGSGVEDVAVAQGH